jgi:hypothetical protein
LPSSYPTSPPCLSTLFFPALAREASQAFVEEYFAHVPEFWRDGFPTRYARAVLKRAAKISRRQSQMPGRPDKVEALIKQAKSSLAGQNLG